MVVLPLSLCSPPVMAPCLSRGPTQDVSEYILCYYSPTSSPWGGKAGDQPSPGLTGTGGSVLRAEDYSGRGGLL